MTFTPPLSAHRLVPATRRISVLLVDLVGSTRLASSLPLTVFSDLMGDVLQIMTLTCEARNGEVLPHQGDAVVSLWDASEVARAAAAASDLHARFATAASVSRLGLDLHVRVGIASGEAMVGPVGGNFSAFGLPMSLARRLCDGADPGQTLVCPETCLGLPEDEYVPLGVRAFQDFPMLRVADLHATPSHMRMKSS